MCVCVCVRVRVRVCVSKRCTNSGQVLLLPTVLVVFFFSDLWVPEHTHTRTHTRAHTRMYQETALAKDGYRAEAGGGREGGEVEGGTEGGEREGGGEEGGREEEREEEDKGIIEA